MAGKKTQETGATTHKKPVLVLYPRGILIGSVVVFCVCGWMFTLGLLTGRGTLPVESGFQNIAEHFAGAAKENRIKISRVGTASVKPAESQSEETPAEFRFLKELAEKESPALRKEKRVIKKQIKIHPPDKAAEPPQEVVLPQPPPARQDTPPAPEKRVAEKKAPAPAPEPPKPDGVKKNGKYSIQVAAFKEKAHAEKEAEKLRAKGFNAHVQVGKSVKGAIWYRLKVGFFDQRSESVDTMKKLSGQGYNGFFVNN